MPPTHILKTKYYLIVMDDLNAEAVEAVGIGLDRALFARPDSTLTRHVPLSFSFSLSFSRWSEDAEALAAAPSILDTKIRRQ